MRTTPSPKTPLGGSMGLALGLVALLLVTGGLGLTVVASASLLF
ncbi:hypothetical protein [Pararhodospirillum oryzae]|nr:hypothetical protein [Pararhodospirillum oryzae]